MSDLRINNEIAHGKYLAENGAGEIWNWETPAGKVRWARRVKMLTSHLSKNDNVLEIGCGTGYFTKEIAPVDSKVTAIDISPELIELAKHETKNFNNIYYKVENAYEMSFTDNSFDTVIGSSVLHHLDIKKALSEIYRVLKPGGIIKFTEPNMMNPQIALQKNIPYLKRKLGDSPDETAFFKWQIKRLLKQQGFMQIKVTCFDFLHPSIPKPLIPLFNFTGMFFEKIPLFKGISGSLFIEAKK